MGIEDIIDSYNQYITNRRKETHTESSAILVLNTLVKSLLNNETQIIFEIQYIKEDLSTVIFQYSITDKVIEQYKLDDNKEILKSFLVAWINFFSEYEDKIVDGKRWN